MNLDAKKAPAGEMDVVLNNGWSGVLLHEALGHTLEGDFLYKKTSVFHDQIGNKIGNENITVVDEGNISGRRGSLNMDDEGEKTQRKCLNRKWKIN